MTGNKFLSAKVIFLVILLLLTLSVTAFLYKNKNNTMNNNNNAQTELKIEPLDKNLKELKKTSIKQGTGRAIEKGDIAYVIYAGLLPDGTVFDTNAQTGQAIGFPIGEGAVIKGWDQGLIGVKEGEEIILDIPADLAYGKDGTPDGRIPPNTPLRFDILVVKVMNKEEAAKYAQEQAAQMQNETQKEQENAD